MKLTKVRATPTKNPKKIVVRRRDAEETEYESDDGDRGWDLTDADAEVDTSKGASDSRRESVLKAFEEVWGSLFASPVHLDSALSKQPKNRKGILATIVPRILLRPVSSAEDLGVGIGPDEPWGLDRAKLTRWRAAILTAERLYEMMSSTIADSAPTEADFPPAMITEWKREWGDGVVEKLVATLGREAPLSLRVNRRMSPATLLKKFRERGDLPVKAAPSDFSPTGLRLSGYLPLFRTNEYQSGAFEIQDEGSQTMAWFALWPELFAPLLSKVPSPIKIPAAPIAFPATVPPWTVVDACAGAGGKTLALGDALGGKGRVYSYDISDKKLAALRKRAKRAGLNNFQAVKVEEGQEALVTKRFRRRADVVLVDAPCSGWGVLRRNPDIKWRQDPATLARMPEIQDRLLQAYSDLVAPGGRLVFGVCTFRRAETTDIVDAFLAKNPEFEKLQGGYLGPGPSDGFFMQAFKRRKT